MAVRTWSRLSMTTPTWLSRSPTVLATVAPLLISWLISAVSPSKAPDTFSTNALASFGLMAERKGPKELRNAFTLASETSWVSGMVAPGFRVGPSRPGKRYTSFWPITLCQRRPTSVP